MEIRINCNLIPGYLPREFRTSGDPFTGLRASRKMTKVVVLNGEKLHLTRTFIFSSYDRSKRTGKVYVFQTGINSPEIHIMVGPED